MIINSERLFIRKLTIRDINDFHNLQASPNVMKYIIHRPKTRRENENELVKILKHDEMNNDDFTVLAVCKNDHEFIGTCAIIKNDENDFEIGYRIAEEFWGNGFGSELLQLLITYCFKVRSLESIVAYVESKNIHSVKMLQKCGMELINEFIDKDWGQKVQFYRLKKEEYRNL